jgi:hypothetical protein
MMAEPGSFADRQAQYAAWRDRLRQANDVIDLDAPEVDEPSDEWSPEALFRSTTGADD